MKTKGLGGVLLLIALLLGIAHAVVTPESAYKTQRRAWVYAVNQTVLSAEYPATQSALSAAPGDSVWLKFELYNTGSLPLQPTEFVAALSPALEFDAGSASNQGWALENGMLRAAYAGPLLQPGERYVRDLVVKLRDTGEETIAQGFTVNGYLDENRQTMAEPNSAETSVQFSVNRDAARFQSGIQLVAIDGAPVTGFAGTLDPNVSVDLDYRIWIKNIGTVAAKPEGFHVSLTKELRLRDAAQDAGWAAEGDKLYAQYAGAALRPGESAEMALRLRADGAKLSIGKALDVHAWTSESDKTALRISVGYGDIAQTGEGMGNFLLPVAGLLLIGIGVGALLLLRVRRHTAR